MMSREGEPLTDEVWVTSPNSGAPQKVSEAAVYSADGNTDSEKDDLQWGYTPRSRFGECLNRLVPHGGAISNVYCMCAVTLGSGIFSLPYAFRSSGIAVAIVVLLAISAATVYSVYIMIQAVEKTRVLAKAELANKHCADGHAAHEADSAGSTPPSSPPSSPPSPPQKKGGFVGSLMHLNEEGNSVSTLFLCSYESLARGLLGVGWDYFAAFNMWFFCFGSCVSYVITVNDLISTALKSGNQQKSGWLFTNEWGSKVLTAAVWAVVMLPLSIPKQINALRYFSVITVMFIVYFSIVVIVHSGQNSFYRTSSGETKLKNSLSAAKSGNGSINGFSMFLFAFLLQTNVLQLHKESLKPSAKRMTRDTGIATIICTSLYILVGFFGYAEFGEALEGTILREYDLAKEPAIAVGYVLLGFKLSVSFAICMLPSRDSVYYCIGTNARTIRREFHVVIVVFMCIVALVLGLVIPDVEIVFSLTGSLGGGFLGFVFPALFVMYAGNWGLRQVGWFHWSCTYLLLIAGVIAIVFGTCAAIWSMT